MTIFLIKFGLAYPCFSSDIFLWNYVLVRLQNGYYMKTGPNVTENNKIVTKINSKNYQLLQPFRPVCTKTFVGKLASTTSRNYKSKINCHAYLKTTAILFRMSNFFGQLSKYNQKLQNNREICKHIQNVGEVSNNK